MTIIKNGFVIDPASNLAAFKDISVQDGRILRITDPGAFDPARDPASEAEIIDAAGLIISPGFVDTHSHFRDPGQTHKEDIHTGAASAVRGGYTSIVMMANTRPVIDSKDILSHVMNRIREVNDRVPLHILPTATSLPRPLPGLWNS